MSRPIFTLAIVCVLASACAREQSQKPGDQAAPAPAASARPTTESPAPAATPAAAPSATQPESSTAASAAPSTAAASKEREFRDVTIPAGRTISVTLTTPIASDTSNVEDPVRGTLAKPIIVGGTTVVPAGAPISGNVLEANQSGRVKGLASVAFRFDRLTVQDEAHDIRTARIRRQATPNRKDDLKKGGIGAGVGAIVGGIIGGGKGAAIGAGAGGAGTVLATRGSEVRLPAGVMVTTTLQQPLTLSVPRTDR